MLDVALQQLDSSNQSIDDVFRLLSRRLDSCAKLIRDTYERHYV